MTDGLVLLVAWAQLVLLLALLLYFVLRRSDRDPHSASERRTADEP